MTFAPVDPDLDPDDLDIDLSESSEPEVIESSTPTIAGPGKDDKETRGRTNGKLGKASEGCGWEC